MKKTKLKFVLEFIYVADPKDYNKNSTPKQMAEADQKFLSNIGISDIADFISGCGDVDMNIKIVPVE